MILLPHGTPTTHSFITHQRFAQIIDLKLILYSHVDRYSWHRHTCGLANNTQHFDSNATCYTPGDNSPQNMSTVDEAWIVRPAEAQCPNRWASSAESIPVEDSDDNTQPQPSTVRFSAAEIGLSAACFVLLAIVIVQFWHGRSKVS